MSEAQNYPRQYNVEFGPWDAAGAPISTLIQRNVQTNYNYVDVMIGGDIHLGLILSTDSFVSRSIQSTGRTMWAVVLAPVRCAMSYETPELNVVFNLDPKDHVLYATGAIISLRWNRRYIFQDEAGHAELIRVVDCNPGSDPIGDGEPPLRHHHQGGPTFPHDGHTATDFSTALAQLKLLE
jgi:hypothetical protein